MYCRSRQPFVVGGPKNEKIVNVQTHNPPIIELLKKSYISISFICSIFTPENFNIQSFDNDGDDIYLLKSNPNLSQIPFLKFSKISYDKFISNFR